MSKNRVTKISQLSVSDALAGLNHQIDCLEKFDYSDLNYAAGAIRGLGDIVFTYHGNGVEGLNKSDMESIGLAIMSLGRHVEIIVQNLETDCKTMREWVEEARGAA